MLGKIPVLVMVSGSLILLKAEKEEKVQSLQGKVISCIKADDLLEKKRKNVYHNQILGLTSTFLSLKHQTLHMVSLYCLFQENRERSHSLPFLIYLHICVSVGLFWQKHIACFPQEAKFSERHINCTDTCSFFHPLFGSKL